MLRRLACNRHQLGGVHARYLTKTPFSANQNATVREKLEAESSAVNKNNLVNDQSMAIGGRIFPTDQWTNVPLNLQRMINDHQSHDNAQMNNENGPLHQRPNHPISIVRRRIERWFLAQQDQNNQYAVMDAPRSPIVTTRQNFDELLVPVDHISRSPHDSYFINHEYMLRAHTSAHQVQMLRDGHFGFLLTGDVYRRDSVDPSHYPVFHQMEGVRVFERTGKLWQADVEAETTRLAKLVPGYDARAVFQWEDDDAVQYVHRDNVEEMKTVGEHLRVNLEGMIRQLLGDSGTTADGEPLPIRWVPAYFPFTSPSWEMEIFYRGQWLEVCGCGVIRDEVLRQADLNQHIGWAFGLGLERIAMTLFDIPDIRLFWSKDPRFTKQFHGDTLTQFKPFSKYPATYKDISFWLSPSFHENSFCELVRTVCGDLVEDVRLVDEFVHPKTQLRSQCYRIMYRSMERTLTNEEVDQLQDVLCARVVEEMQVKLR